MSTILVIKALSSNTRFGSSSANRAFMYCIFIPPMGKRIGSGEVRNSGNSLRKRLDTDPVTDPRGVPSSITVVSVSSMFRPFSKGTGRP